MTLLSIDNKFILACMKRRSLIGLEFGTARSYGIVFIR